MDDTSLSALTRFAPQTSTSAVLAGDGPAAGVGYLPAVGHTARVGGDWADIISVGSAICDEPDAVRTAGTTAFVIGDVMGHGPHLAGRSHVARTLLANALRDRGPAAALHLLDVSWCAVTAWADTTATACVVTATPLTPTTPGHLRSVAGASPPDQPVTGWLLSWSSAGHPAPLLVAPDGTTTTLLFEEGDLPVGVDHTRPRHGHSAVIPDGCSLLLFTDGVIEHRNPSVDGLAHLAALTAELGRDSRSNPAATAGRLLAARAPHLDTGDESTLLVAHLDSHMQPRHRLVTRFEAA